MTVSCGGKRRAWHDDPHAPQLQRMLEQSRPCTRASKIGGEGLVLEAVRYLDRDAERGSDPKEDRKILWKLPLTFKIRASISFSRKQQIECVALCLPGKNTLINLSTPSGTSRAFSSMSTLPKSTYPHGLQGGAFGKGIHIPIF